MTSGCGNIFKNTIIDYKSRRSYFKYSISIIISYNSSKLTNNSNNIINLYFSIYHMSILRKVNNCIINYFTKCIFNSFKSCCPTRSIINIIIILSVFGIYINNITPITNIRKTSSFHITHVCPIVHCTNNVEFI